MKVLALRIACSCVLAGILIGLAACPRNPGQARVITLFAGDAHPAKTLAEALFIADKGGPVALEDIQSLTVTVTRVTLLRDTGDADAAGEVVFEGAVDVDVMTLVGLSEVLSEATVEAGTYEKIVLNISNPRLVLLADPGTVIEGEDIHLTANGRLFIGTAFTLPADQTSLVLLDFEDLHLVEEGNGTFNLTPQLRADVSVTNAAVTLEGEIVSVDLDNDLLVIALTDGEVEVIYTDADIFLVADTDVPNGLETDLLPGLQVRIEGLMHVDGSITATAVFLLE